LITRLAPSPTGALHLGNARTFLVTWAIARKLNWRIVLRIEDLDGPRIKPGAGTAAIETLRWLGLDWDMGPYTQSDNLVPYAQALSLLQDRGLAFPSDLTRQQLEAALSAPQEGSHEARFPDSLRPAWFTPGRPVPSHPRGDATNWRFATPSGTVDFDDRLAGPQRHAPAESIGDFIIWTKSGTPAYQLAVVVDDARQGVTDVIRGDDLLDSAARQLLLYRALGLAPEPRYWHLPLVLGPDGRRLAKRHGDSRIVTYRALGVPPEAIIGLLAHWTLPPGHRPDRPEPTSARAFMDALDPTTIPRTPCTLTPEDDRWLRAQART